MDWIEISKIDDYPEIENKSILVWQENLSDSSCSSFQRAIFNKGDSRISDSITIY